MITKFLNEAPAYRIRQAIFAALIVFWVTVSIVIAQVIA